MRFRALGAFFRLLGFIGTALKALRTHALRLSGPKTMLHQGFCWAFLILGVGVEGLGFRVSQRVQSTYIVVECRASIIGITVMIWESIPGSLLDTILHFCYNKTLLRIKHDHF